MYPSRDHNRQKKGSGATHSVKRATFTKKKKNKMRVVWMVVAAFVFVVAEGELPPPQPCDRRTSATDCISPIEPTLGTSCVWCDAVCLEIPCGVNVSTFALDNHCTSIEGVVQGCQVLDALQVLIWLMLLCVKILISAWFLGSLSPLDPHPQRKDRCAMAAAVVSVLALGFVCVWRFHDASWGLAVLTIDLWWYVIQRFATFIANNKAAQHLIFAMARGAMIVGAWLALDWPPALATTMATLISGHTRHMQWTLRIVLATLTLGVYLLCILVSPLWRATCSMAYVALALSSPQGLVDVVRPLFFVQLVLLVAVVLVTHDRGASPPAAWCVCGALLATCPIPYLWRLHTQKADPLQERLHAQEEYIYGSEVNHPVATGIAYTARTDHLSSLP